VPSALRTNRQLTRSDPAPVLCRFEVLPQDLQLSAGEVVNKEVRNLLLFLHINSMVIRTIRSQDASLVFTKGELLIIELVRDMLELFRV
jgi:hypothetical protein